MNETKLKMLSKINEKQLVMKNSITKQVALLQRQLK